MSSLRRATWIDYLSLGVAVIFTEACFVVLTSTLAAPIQEVATFVHVELFMDGDDREGGEEAGDVDFSGNKPGNWLFRPNLERNLPKRSNHKPSNKPEVFIQLENSTDAMALLNSRIHLRAFCFSRFDGVKWSAIPMPRREMKAPIRFARKIRAEEAREFKSIRHHIFHGLNPTGQNMFTALSGVVSTDVTSLTQLGEEIYLLPVLSDREGGYDYMARSRPIHFTELINQRVRPARAPADALALPAHLSVRLNQTAEVFKLESDLVRQLVAVQHYLQDSYHYSLETKNVQNANPLENFLYIEKRGYCEHFATAAAMFARTLGVPSRIAYGWSGGRLYKSQNMFVFRAKDAHAWTEIKLDGYGWVVFDTTPPDDDAVPESHAAPESELAPDPQDVIAQQYAQQVSEGGGEQSLSLKTNPRPQLIALGVIAFCVFGFFIMRVFSRPETAPDGVPLKHPTPAYFLLFKQTCAFLGYPMPVGRTLRQQVEYLRSKDAASDILDELLDYHYGLLYGEQAKDKVKEKELKRGLVDWGKRVTNTHRK